MVQLINQSVKFVIEHMHDTVEAVQHYWFMLEDKSKQTLLKLSTAQKKQTTQNTAKQN